MNDFSSNFFNNLNPSIIYKVKVSHGGHDYWFVFNRSCDFGSLSSKYVDVLNAIGLHCDFTNMFEWIFNMDETEDIKIVDVYPEYPNLDHSDQKVLNQLKLNYCHEQNRIDPYTHFYRIDKLCDSIISEDEFETINKKSDLRIDNIIKNSCREWFNNIYEPLKKFKKGEGDNELTELAKQLSNMRSELNRTNKNIETQKSYLDKLHADYHKVEREQQDKLDKKKSYRDRLLNNIEHHEKKLEDLEKQIKENESYLDTLRRGMREKDELALNYLAEKLGYKITK